MHELNCINSSIVLKKLKKALKINTDIQLSEFLQVKPNTISTWKKRNSLDFNAIIAISELYEIDLNELFFENRAPKASAFATQTPLVSRELQFQYCAGNSNSFLESLPKYSFPIVTKQNTRAFQVVSNNMFPLIEENSIVVCQELNLNDVEDNGLVVVVSQSKGLFINRINRSRENQNGFILSNENTFFNTINISAKEINEIWHIKSVFSTNLNNPQKFKFIDEKLKEIEHSLQKIKS